MLDPVTLDYSKRYSETLTVEWCRLKIKICQRLLRVIQKSK